MKKIIIIILIAIFVLIKLNYKEKEFVMENLPEPIQANQKHPPILKNAKGSRVIITPKADYKIYAKAASVKHYMKIKPQDYIMPYDFALVWGKMMDEKILEKVKISQSSRWYHFRYKHPAPIEHRYIETHSANVHIIPKDKNLERALGQVKKGDNIYLEGYLVDIEIIDLDKKITIKSSTTRDDTGAGACEVLYVTKLARNAKGLK